MKKTLLLLSAGLFILVIGVIALIPNPIERIQKEIEKAECVKQCKQDPNPIKSCSSMCQGEVWFNGPEEHLEQIDPIEIKRDNSFKER